jgi:hypothetical protein
MTMPGDLGDDFSLNMADSVQFEPTISMVLAEIFKDYRFMFHDQEITSSEIFSDRGFLPIMIANAMVEFERIDADVESAITADDQGLLGLTGSIIIRNKSEAFIWIAEIILTAKGFFGYDPQEVYLDKLLNSMMNLNAKPSIPLV